MRIYVDGVVESKYKSLLLLKLKHSKVFDVAGTDSSNRAYYGKKAHYFIYIITPKLRTMTPYLDVILDSSIYGKKVIVYVKTLDEDKQFSKNVLEGVEYLKEIVGYSNSFFTTEQSQVTKYIMQKEIARLLTIILGILFIAFILFIMYKFYIYLMSITEEELTELIIKIINKIKEG